MKTFKIEVSDRRNKYPSRTYEIQAEEEFLAYGPATEQFIKDNGHPPMKMGQRQSVYYSRFYSRVI